jgi:hypothetical protein
MPRQTLAVTNSPGPFPAAGVAVTMTAEDIANHSRFPLTGRELLLIWNSHATTTYTYTVYSVADQAGRVLDITAQNIVAQAIHVLGPLSTNQGWRQSDGGVNVDANNASVKFGVIVLPN